MKSLSGPEKQYSCRQVYEEGAALLEELEDGRLDARLLLEHFCGINTNRLHYRRAVLYGTALCGV